MKTTPCERCDSRCCRTYIVPLNGIDIVRISLHLGTPISEWCVLEPISEQISEYAYFSIRLTGETRYIVCLKRENGSCMFLQRSSLRAACGIYEARPGMCRSYPITYCAGSAEHTDGCICPERWALDFSDEAIFSRLYIEYNAAFADFKELTDLWERSYRSKDIMTGYYETDLQTFLTFLSRQIGI